MVIGSSEVDVSSGVVNSGVVIIGVVSGAVVVGASVVVGPVQQERLKSKNSDHIRIPFTFFVAYLQCFLQQKMHGMLFLSL